MCLPFAEDLSYEDCIKKTRIPFSSPISIGRVQWWKFKERGLTGIDNVPLYQGLYIWWALFMGRLIPFYAGMSDDLNGIRSRIKRELFYSQNEGHATCRLSGPLRALNVFLSLGHRDVPLYLTTAPYVGRERISAKEKQMLARVDFAANEQNNGAGRHMDAFRATLIKTMLRAATMDNGTVVANPTFAHYLDRELYENCVCGKDIKYNHTAYCPQTGKAFILGSECIERVCSELGYSLLRECCICHDTIETGDKCKECSLMKRRRNNKVGVGKYSEHSYADMLAIPSYCRWLKSQVEVSGKLSQLQQWLSYIEMYPTLLNEGSDTDRIAHVESVASELTFGKHRGRTYEDMFEKEKGYCTWVLSQESPSGGMKDFKEWLESR